MSSVDNVIPSSPPPSPPPANGPVDVLGFSLSLVVIVAGTVVFSSLVASVVAVLVTKSTQAVSLHLIIFINTLNAAVVACVY